MMELVLTLCLCISTLTFTCADIYLHNPRGSNNRLSEEGRERTNANRLFDSQNNNRGGYNVGSVYYYTGSKLQIEWSDQHSCGNDNSHCDLIIQYMCGDLVRDGASTKAPDLNPSDCYNSDCDTDLEHGLHEDHAYYLHCRQRERNKGLFVADQKPGRKATSTRQNPGGARRGYECAEERDYYPYWHPSPWKDIAVRTNDVQRCPYYQAESQNVKSRWYCHLPRDFLLANVKSQYTIPTNQWDCEAFRYPQGSPDAVKGVWTEVPAHGIAAPDCLESPVTRDNHHGNTQSGYFPNYNWTIPDDVHEHCVLRVRYNISTNDYLSWDGADASNNELKKNTGADVGLHAKYGFADKAAADERGYQFKNNPKVKMFSGLDGFNLQLAINTAQYGRTFQDRSHTFAIRPRPDSIDAGDVIHNVNVRGKRGNIVQVYPGVEYDFVPNTLELAKDQYIHFQWTGSNSNPAGNDGQGARGSDRSNVVLQAMQAYDEGTGKAYEFDTKYGHWGRSYPQKLTNESLLGWSVADMEKLALLTSDTQFRGSLAELNDVGTYFDMGAKLVKETGVYHYLSTRNNNFSNRSQKGRLISRAYVVEQMSIGWNGGTFALSNEEAKLTVERGAFTTLQDLRMEQWAPDQGKEKVKAKDRKLPSGGDFAGDFLVIHPEAPLTTDGRTVTVEMKISYKGMDNVQLYQSDSNFFTTWTKVDADISGGKATFQTTEGGVFIALVDSNIGVIIGAVIGSLLFVALIVAGTVWYCRKHPTNFHKITRSLQKKV